jgi:hypothetical protein
LTVGLGEPFGEGDNKKPVDEAASKGGAEAGWQTTGYAR